LNASHGITRITSRLQLQSQFIKAFLIHYRSLSSQVSPPFFWPIALLILYFDSPFAPCIRDGRRVLGNGDQGHQTHEERKLSLNYNNLLLSSFLRHETRDLPRSMPYLQICTVTPASLPLLPHPIPFLSLVSAAGPHSQPFPRSLFPSLANGRSDSSVLFDASTGADIEEGRVIFQARTLTQT